MKKNLRFWTLLALTAAAGSAALAATLTVMVEQTQVRKRPQFFAPAAATVKLGAHLPNASESPTNGWYTLKGSDGSVGYIHESAVTTKKVKLAARAAGESGTSAEEITLAGKGFNEQVESSYKAGHAELDFSKVDAMEKRSIADDKLLPFMRSGNLLPQTAKGGDR